MKMRGGVAQVTEAVILFALAAVASWRTAKASVHVSQRDQKAHVAFCNVEPLTVLNNVLCTQCQCELQLCPDQRLMYKKPQPKQTLGRVSWMIDRRSTCQGLTSSNCLCLDRASCINSSAVLCVGHHVASEQHADYPSGSKCNVCVALHALVLSTWNILNGKTQHMPSKMHMCDAMT